MIQRMSGSQPAQTVCQLKRRLIVCLIATGPVARQSLSDFLVRHIVSRTPYLFVESAPMRGAGKSRRAANKRLVLDAITIKRARDRGTHRRNPQRPDNLRLAMADLPVEQTRIKVGV